MVNWKQDLTLAVVLLFLSVAFYVTGLEYPDTTAMFPSHLSPILGVLAVLLAVSALRRREPGQALVNWRAARGPIVLVALTAVLILSLSVIGFIPACFLVASAIFLLLGYPNKGIAIGVALVASVAIYLIFHTVLGVSLPEGTLWEGTFMEGFPWFG